MTTKKTKPAAAEADADATVVPANPDATGKPTKPPLRPKGDKGKPTPAKAPKPRQKPTRRDGEAKPEREPRTDTKQAGLIAMLRDAEGVTIEEAVKAFGWQPHTVRGTLYGALKQKLGLSVISEKVEGRSRVYRIGS